jgi:hypothetical protein
VNIEPVEESLHEGCIDEWWFGWWVPGGAGGICGHRSDPVQRLLGYWWAWVAPGEKLLHIADWQIPMRTTDGLMKGELLWAEHVCEFPLEQWTVSNESRATAIDGPTDVKGLGYGMPTAIASDLEWYAVSPSVLLDEGHGYEQSGVVHGVVEVEGRSPFGLDEISAWRCHRWWTNGSDIPKMVMSRTSDREADVIFQTPEASLWTFSLDEHGWSQVM